MKAKFPGNLTTVENWCNSGSCWMNKGYLYASLAPRANLRDVSWPDRPVDRDALLASSCGCRCWRKLSVPSRLTFETIPARFLYVMQYIYPPARTISSREQIPLGSIHHLYKSDIIWLFFICFDVNCLIDAKFIWHRFYMAIRSQSCMNKIILIFTWKEADVFR